MKTKQDKARKNLLLENLGAISHGIPQIKIRYRRPTNLSLVKVKDSKDAANFLRKVFDDNTIQLQESFFILLLTTANEIIGYYNVSIGGITATIADPELIFATAIVTASRGIILCHNHPSGNLQPSKADIELTRKIKAGGKLLEIQLLDHIIITKTGYYSFADENIL